MSWRSSPIVGMAFLAIVIAAGTGVNRSGYDQINSTNLSNTSANQTEAFETFTGNLIELLPVLVLVLAGAFVMRAVLDWT